MQLGLVYDHRSDVFHSAQVEFKSLPSQGRPFLAVQTGTLPPLFSYLRNLCRSDNASNSRPVFKARGRLLFLLTWQVKTMESGVSSYPLARPSPRTQARPGRSGLTSSQAEDIDFETG